MDSIREALTLVAVFVVGLLFYALGAVALAEAWEVLRWQ